MKEPSKTKKARSRSLRKEHIVYAALLAVGLFLVGFAVNDLLTGEFEYTAARSEYDSLRELFPVPSMISSGLISPPSSPLTRDAEEAAQIPVWIAADGTEDGTANRTEDGTEDGSADGTTDGTADGLADEPAPEGALSSPGSGGSQISGLPASPGDMLAELSGINPDFIGWIYIEGVLDYPVVRGRDNDRYLNVTFKGTNNPSGAIFMDHRNSKGFDDPVCVLFGHNMRDGSMFKALHKYSSKGFLEEHPDILIVTASGDALYYRIFSVKYEGSRDLLFDLSLSGKTANPSEFRGAPDGASRFLILSTCTNSEDKEERLRVIASLVG